MSLSQHRRVRVCCDTGKTDCHANSDLNFFVKLDIKKLLLGSIRHNRQTRHLQANMTKRYILQDKITPKSKNWNANYFVDQLYLSLTLKMEYFFRHFSLIYYNIILKFQQMTWNLIFSNLYKTWTDDYSYCVSMKTHIYTIVNNIFKLKFSHCQFNLIIHILVNDNYDISIIPVNNICRYVL